MEQTTSTVQGGCSSLDGIVTENDKAVGSRFNDRSRSQLDSNATVVQIREEYIDKPGSYTDERE